MIRNLVMLCALFAAGLAGCGSDDAGGAASGGGAGSGANAHGDAGDRAGDLPDGAICSAGATRCEGERRLSTCAEGGWVLSGVCAEGQTCSLGACIEPGACTPGEVTGCMTAVALRQCTAAGDGYKETPCPANGSCVQGQCTQTACQPGQTRCASTDSLERCGDDGEWAIERCPDDASCAAGRCISGCDRDFKWQSSNVGCEYWSVDLDQAGEAFVGPGATPPATSPHAVVLSNPGEEPAELTFSTRAAGIVLAVPEATLAPGETRGFDLPRMDLDGTGRFDRTVRIQSSRPVVATQFNPRDAAETFSNDSSLLLPAEALGTRYLILAWGSLAPQPLTGASTKGFFTVVATRSGATEVSVRLNAEADPMEPGGPKLRAGAIHTFTIEQYEALQFQGTSQSFAAENDLSGSLVLADQPVAVFAGHEAPSICPDVARQRLCGPGTIGGGDCSCCLEHLEEQLWPVDSWSSEYLAAKAPKRGAVDFDTWRVQAGAANITLQTDPPIDGLHGVTLAAEGHFVEAVADQSFRIRATGPIQVAQYLAGMGCTSDKIGDPAQIMAVGTDQFRSSYPLLVPNGYDTNWLTVVRPPGSQTTLDGAPASASFTPVPNSDLEVGYLPITPGTHTVTGTEPFGLYQYGFFEATSYGNPVGLNLVDR